MSECNNICFKSVTLVTVHWTGINSLTAVIAEIMVMGIISTTLAIQMFLDPQI